MAAAALVLGAPYLMPDKIVDNPDNCLISQVLYHGTEVSVDEKELLGLLHMYSAKKTVHRYFPYQNDTIEIEITLSENHRPKHILLGNFYIWYGSANKGAYAIENGQALKEADRSYSDPP